MWLPSELLYHSFTAVETFFDSKTTVSTWPEYIEQFSGNFKWVDWVGSNSALFEHVYDVLFYIVALFSCQWSTQIYSSFFLLLFV